MTVQSASPVLGAHYYAAVSTMMILSLVSARDSVAGTRQCENSRLEVFRPVTSPTVHDARHWAASGVRLLHAPYAKELQFTRDGRILVSMAESIRYWCWRSGALLGSISGPEPFSSFAQLNGGEAIVTMDRPRLAFERGWYYGVLQTIPTLRLWDRDSGRCRAVRRLTLPSDSTNVSFSPIESADTTVWLVVSYQRQAPAAHGPADVQRDEQRLLGFRDSDLVQTHEVALDPTPVSPKWDERTGYVLYYGTWHLGAYDPVQNRIVWEERIAEGDESIRGVHIEIPSIVKDHAAPVFALLGDRVSREMKWTCIDAKSGRQLQVGANDAAEREEWGGLGRERHPTPRLFWLYDGRTLSGWDPARNEKRITVPHRDGDWEARDDVWSPDGPDDAFHDDSHGGDPLAWTDAGGVVALGGWNDEAIHVFDIRNGQRVATPTGTVTALARGKAGRYVAALDADTIWIVDLEPPTTDFSQLMTSPDPLSSVAVSGNGEFFAAGDAAGTVYVGRIAEPSQMDRQKIARLAGLKDRVVGLAIGHDGREIFACDARGCFLRWRREQASEPWSNEIQASNWPDGPTRRRPDCLLGGEAWLTSHLCQIASSATVGTVFYPHPPLGPEAGGIHEPVPEPAMNIAANLYSRPPLGQQFAAIVDPIQLGSVMVLGEHELDLAPAVPHHTKLKRIRTTGDGRYTSLLFDSGQITIVDVREGTFVSMIHTQDEGVVDVEYHPERDIVLSASYLGTVTAWNTETSRAIAGMTVPDCRLAMLSSRWVADGFDIVLGTRDSGLVVYRRAFAGLP